MCEVDTSTYMVTTYYSYNLDIYCMHGTLHHYMGLSALQHVRVHDAWLWPGTDCIAKHDGYSASICSKYTDELACSIPSYNRGLVCIANIKTTFEYVLHTKTKGNSGLCSFFYFFHTLWVSL